MPTTIKNIKGTELPPSLRNRFNVKEYQFLTVTIEVEDDNMWDTVIESARQTHKDLKMGKATLISLLGTNNTIKYADNLKLKIFKSLKIFGKKGDDFRETINYILNRTK